MDLIQSGSIRGVGRNRTTTETAQYSLLNMGAYLVNVLRGTPLNEEREACLSRFLESAWIAGTQLSFSIEMKLRAQSQTLT